jgi:hypothetical protein
MRPEQWVAIGMAIRSVLAPSEELNGWLNVSITTEDHLALPGEIKEQLTAVLLHLVKYGSAKGSDLLNGAPPAVFGQPTVDLQIACGMSPIDRLRTKARLQRVIEAKLLAGTIMSTELVDWVTHREYNITVAA